jgi:hypothetical protein
MNSLNSVLSKIDKSKISTVLNNDYVTAVLTILTIVYASMAAPNLPSWFVKLFRSNLFKILYLTLLLMIPIKQSPHVAIIVAIFFVATLNFINKNDNIKKLFVVSEYKNYINHKTASYNNQSNEANESNEVNELGEVAELDEIVENNDQYNDQNNDQLDYNVNE